MRFEILEVGEVDVVVFDEVVECCGTLVGRQLRYGAAVLCGREIVVYMGTGVDVEEIIAVGICRCRQLAGRGEEPSLFEVEKRFAAAVVVQRFDADIVGGAQKESDREGGCMCRWKGGIVQCADFFTDIVEELCIGFVVFE